MRARLLLASLIVAGCSPASTAPSVGSDARIGSPVDPDGAPALVPDFQRADGTPLVVDGGAPNPYHLMPLSWKVNGNTLKASEQKWVKLIGETVVTRLQGDARAQLNTAAKVTWWSLKEGILDVSNPIAYSNCNFTTGDKTIGPLETCPTGRAWQVGLSAVQVPGRTLSDLNSVAAALYPGKSTDQLLADTAAAAGYAAGSTTSAGIVASTGSLRISWLLRVPPIGFVKQAPTIQGECMDQSLSWCFGTGWTESKLYAPTKAGALRSIDDLWGLLLRLSRPDCQPGAAQVVGVVRDASTGQPINPYAATHPAGVLVSCAGQLARVGQDGSFGFCDVKPGTYTVSATNSYYETGRFTDAKKDVTVVAGQRVVVELPMQPK
jgi:hypothetical protein